jgi:hypothetical protein
MGADLVPTKAAGSAHSARSSKPQRSQAIGASTPESTRRHERVRQRTSLDGMGLGQPRWNLTRLASFQTRLEKLAMQRSEDQRCRQFTAPHARVGVALTSPLSPPVSPPPRAKYPGGQAQNRAGGRPCPARALADDALEVGEHVGLPFHRFPLERTADAHDAVERGAVGKVLVDIS